MAGGQAFFKDSGSGEIRPDPNSPGSNELNDQIGGVFGALGKTPDRGDAEDD
jgi:hypothetical protein